MIPPQRSIPAVLNSKSGTVDAAREALAADGRFDVRETEPEQLEAGIRALVASGASRILVAGGDGTIATAASTMLDGTVELAILPGGTLNHFARDLGISTDAAEALETAATSACRPVDVGMVNDRLFLNTSSVGAYVKFVRLRERLEPRFGYRIASAIAALRILFQLRLMAVELDVEGEKRIYRTALVFIGVGERELQLPKLGNRVQNGRRGLHVIIVRGRSRARLLAIALYAVARGLKTAARGPELDSFIVERCTITHRARGRVAVDGEVETLGTTLEYALRRDAIKVVCP